MGGTVLLVGACGEVGAVMTAALVQLGRSVAIFGSIGSDCHGFGLYPHHDWLSLKHPNLFSEVLVGLMMCTVDKTVNVIVCIILLASCQMVLRTHCRLFW